jgi:RHS repeat-associated protein
LKLKWNPKGSRHTASYYQTDGLGSVTSLSSTAGALANTYTYDSFGKTTNSTGSIANRFQYTAREFDPETNLYFYRARYYDPNVGRFIREDPRKEVVRGMNFYAYVRNDAPNFSDPDGREPCGWWCNLWKRLKWGKETYEPVSSAMDWTLCGVYYLECLETGMGIKKELAEALDSRAPGAYEVALATLAQQLGTNSMDSINVKVCMHNENCEKALLCAQKGLTNPFPFPIN